MPKTPTAYHRPDSLQEALQILTHPDTFPLAGGTKLLAQDVNGAVVDLQNLALNQVEWADGHLHVGATATLDRLAQALETAEDESGAGELLLQAIRQAGPNTYRHAATMGGTIAARQPDSELLAVLLALGAQLSLQGPSTANVSLAAYLAADAQPSGLITQVQIPWQPGRGGSARVARTPADSPIVSVVLWLPAAGDPALAATGLGKRPFLLEDAASSLAAGVNEANIAAAAAAARAASHHPGDFRGNAAYRGEMAAVLTKRVCTFTASTA